MPKFLHVGCGHKKKDDTSRGFLDADWEEVRLDIDPGVRPDIVGSMTDMRAVASGSMDALFSSHNIEHLYAHEVPGALLEFRRVLKPDGFVVITCPDLESVCKVVAQGRLLDPLYTSPAGPISALDVLYGYRPAIAAGNHFMAHKWGYSFETLARCLGDAGFRSVFGASRPLAYDIWLLAFKTEKDLAFVETMAARFLPS